MGTDDIPKIQDELARVLTRVFHLDTEYGRALCAIYLQNPLLKILLEKAVQSLEDEKVNDSKGTKCGPSSR